LILELIGTPSEEDINDMKSEGSRRYLQSLGYIPRVDLKLLFPNTSDAIVKFLNRSLAFNPKKRITASEALADPCFIEDREVEFEIVGNPIEKHLFNFEIFKDSFKVEDIKNLIYRSFK
jgi:mitogen-activated protein kinase 1/3